MLAQQLAQHILTLNGVGIDWDVDWQIEDWLVPADTWVHHGTWMGALTELAQAVGAYVQPHNTDKCVRILPRYPVMPWNWSSVVPHYDLPAGLAEVRATDFVDRAIHNRIWVGGEGAGVAGWITRAGTAGDQVAEQVIHPLITAAQAQRMRGAAELANTGSQEYVTLTLQVLPQTGLILPGTWVRHSFPSASGREIFGIVRRLDVGWQSPTLRQSITLETHPHV